MKIRIKLVNYSVLGYYSFYKRKYMSLTDWQTITVELTPELEGNVTFEQEKRSEWINLMIGNGWDFYFSPNYNFAKEHIYVTHADALKLYYLWRYEKGKIPDLRDVQKLLDEVDRIRADRR